ncbi:ParB/Srx family N-terminal domain-containing protein [Collinsella aerofaciens]|uniref:ParB/Srx family N-terminal domain-containing protein n=1 Tax=Collinsella aerofaciens TaxID=74426 RepID=UPI003D7BA6AC
MRPMPELEVREMAVADLVPYANNAKKHPKEQIDQIAESISEFGNCDPIAVWHNEDGEAEIVEGHGRVMALKQLGIDTAPVICLDHLTDEQRRIYTHVHNQTTINSGFDEQALIEDMDNLNADWEALGFEEYMPVTDEGFGTEFELPDGDKPNVSQATFILAPEQRDFIMDALKNATCDEDDTFGNVNRNGNALYAAIKEWVSYAER